MRISDWSSDVCSSDLMTAEKRAGFFATANVPAFPIVEIIRDINASGCTIQREDVVESAEGTAFYSSQHYPIRDQHGGIVAVGGVYQNASREALAWLETLAARDRFRDVARLVADWIWETDTSFNRSEEHTSELQSLMRISYAVF